MFMVITFHPELMCIGKVISFRSDMERVKKEKEARRAEKARKAEEVRKAEEAAHMQQNPEVRETETRNADISQSSQETQ